MMMTTMRSVRGPLKNTPGEGKPMGSKIPPPFSLAFLPPSNRSNWLTSQVEKHQGNNTPGKPNMGSMLVSGGVWGICPHDVFMMNCGTTC